MSTCPSTDRLLRLLDDGLPEDEHTELVAHLETCDRCRGALDRLAARSGLWDDLPLLRDDPPCPPTRDVVKDPQAMPPGDDELPLGLFDPPDEPGHLGKLGPYDVIRLIGRGGMGLVFLARDRALDRLVAIKLLTPGMAATAAARRRFAREAKAAAAVAHEHVVAIHAVDTLPQGIPYLVMQYVAGKSVQDVIDRVKTPELAEILRIGSQAAGAGRCPCPRAHPPRHQARQHPVGEWRRAGQDHRLRPGPGGGRRDALAVGRGGGDAAVHVARAGRRRACGSPDRPVQPGERALRPLHRPGRVPR